MDIFKQQIKEEAKEINLLRKRITELNSKVSITEKKVKMLEKELGQYKRIQSDFYYNLVVENPDAGHIKDE